MGLTRALAHLAVNSTRVLIVEAPGHWLTRVELEQQMALRGWHAAWTPANADVLAVCGVPGPELAELAERLWEQMPGPRTRVDVASPTVVGSALEDAATLLLDTPYHRADAEERTQEPRIPKDHGQMDHEGMDHEGMDHEGMDHEGMDHEGMDHEGHGGHGGMDMAPAGIALAQGGQDRDGLEMDVLHLPLGLCFRFGRLDWCCSARYRVMSWSMPWRPSSTVRAKQPAARSPRPHQCLRLQCGAMESWRCWRWPGLMMRPLVLAGPGTPGAWRSGCRPGCPRAVAPHGAEVLVAALVLRGVLVLDQFDLARHDLPEVCRGDAHDRLSSMVERLRSEVCGAAPVPEETGAVPWETMSHLVTGLELATVRLAVASLNLEPVSTVQGVGNA